MKDECLFSASYKVKLFELLKSNNLPQSRLFIKDEKNSINIRCTQLLFATGIEGGIHDHQVLKYQPSLTSRVIF